MKKDLKKGFADKGFDKSEESSESSKGLIDAVDNNFALIKLLIGRIEVLDESVTKLKSEVDYLNYINH